MHVIAISGHVIKMCKKYGLSLVFWGGTHFKLYLIPKFTKETSNVKIKVLLVGKQMRFEIM